jgi:cytoskeletal protein CcmA (bactofilin family)
MLFRKTINKPTTNHTSSANLPAFSNRKTPPTVISQDVNILGNVFSDGVVDIDGRIEGNVRATSVTIRANGKVMGDVHAETVQVYGEVKGILKAKNVELYASCRVEGIIMHESLQVEDGAYIDGKFKRMDKTAEASAAQDALLHSFQEPSSAGDETGNVMPYNVLENLRLLHG